MTGVLRVLQGFLIHLRDVAWVPLAGGVALFVLSRVLRAVAWRNILAAGMRGTQVPVRPIVGAHFAGAGTNAVVPARMGDLLRLRLAHRWISGAGYATLASSLVTESVVDVLVTLAVLAWAITAHVVPGGALIESLAGELPVLAGVAAILLAAAIFVARNSALHNAVLRGLAVLRRPTAYVLIVALPQFAAFGLGLATTICMLTAFHIPATAENALRIEVAQVLATIVPAGTAAIGIRGAATVYLLAGQAPRGTLIDYVVASTTVLTTVSVALAALALLALPRLERSARPPEPATSAAPPATRPLRLPRSQPPQAPIAALAPPPPNA
ncbi:MAG: lysylphosphatidylglycerol synthase domain-containing protein [Solirubrobacteraceae bacterium]